MRNLTRSLAVVSLMAPASAYPLGVGDIKLHSALNQKLNAEIPLIVSKDENPANIRVSLAPPEKFDEAGVPWSYFLSKIKFSTQVRKNGTVVVKVTSNEALKEPFLDFLLEVTWDKGNLYREFTVLIDPPSVYEQPVIPVAEVVTHKPVVKSVKSLPPQPPKRADEEVIVNEMAADSYGPTGRNDTLWDIAKRVRPSRDISIEQMIIALYKANPNAFYKDNVNALMAGKKLKVPDSETILKISKRQAARIFKQQYKEWRSGKATQLASQQKQATSTQTSAPQLELVAPVEAPVNNDVLVTAGQSGTEVKQPEKSNTAASSDTSDSEAKSVHEQELVARLEKLEQQLQIMQQVLAVKDQQLAALQNQKKLNQAQTPTIAAPTADNKKDSVNKAAEAAAGKQTVVSPPVKPVAKPKPKVKQPPVQAKPAPEPETSIFADTYYLIVGGAGIGLLGLLGWLWWRKKKVEEETDADSMFAASSQIVMPDSEAENASFVVEEDKHYDVGTVGESSFLSEFTPSDFDAFDADQNEVDPISEADVYLAYGRYQQAEELMRQAIADQPDRNECKLKLLEILYASENKEAFDEYVKELEDSGMRENTAFWEKVQEIAQEFSPEENSGTVTDTISAAVATTEAVAETQSSEVDEKAGNIDNGLDFDLGDLDLDDSSLEEQEEQILDLDSLDGVDFDLDSFAEDKAETASTEAETETDGQESIDFDISQNDEAGKPVENQAEIPVSSEEELETFDFSGVAEEKPQEDAKESSESEEFDFDFNFDESTFAVDDESPAEEGTVSDLTDMDEFETKIDLARAYIDMGDMDAAKLIAEEVLEKGSEQQKETAQAILDELK